MATDRGYGCYHYNVQQVYPIASEARFLVCSKNGPEFCYIYMYIIIIFQVDRHSVNVLNVFTCI